MCKVTEPHLCRVAVNLGLIPASKSNLKLDDVKFLKCSGFTQTLVTNLTGSSSVNYNF